MRLRIMISEFIRSDDPAHNLVTIMVDDGLQIIYAGYNVSVSTPVSSDDFSIIWYHQNVPLPTFAHFISVFVTIFDDYMVPP